MRGAFLTLALYVWSGGAHLSAQTIAVRAYLDRAQVGVNRQFVVNVEITGTQQVAAQPQLPALDDFALFLGTGSSTSMQMAGGRTTVSVTYQFRYQAIREGTFEIGSATVEFQGRTYRTEPLTLTVSASPPAGGNDELGIGPDDLFVEAAVDKRVVWENEPVVVEYRIFTRLNVNSYSINRLPSAAGFWVEEFELPAQPQVERVVRNGMQYVTAVIRRVAMFPTGSGARTVEPLAIEAQVQVRRRSVDPFEDFFGRSSLFGSRVPVVVASEPLEIEVRPLPPNPPAAFSGVVGGLAVQASVDSDSVSTDQAITFRLAVSGTGNLRTLSDPDVAFPPEFEVFPPDVRETTDRAGGRIRGQRTYEYVLVPRAPGQLTIPAVEVSYFDAGGEAYEVSSSEPLSVRVTGEATVGASIGGRSRREVEAVREDIRFIRIDAPNLTRVSDRTLIEGPGFWVVAVLPILMVGGAFGIRRHQDRLRGDVAFARRRRAAGMAKRRLRNARTVLSEETQREFYAEVGRALQGYLGDHLNFAEAGLIRERAADALEGRGVSTTVASAFLDCLDRCDRQRFAPVASDEADMRSFLERAEHAMADLGQELGR